jgi:dipeptidyl aminopeptidase/acylaminoacyl peptidase
MRASARSLGFVLGLFGAGMVHADLPPLVPRVILFGNPAKVLPSVSPDGRHLAYLAPDPGGVQNIWISGLEGGDARLLTHEAKRPVNLYRWAEDSLHVLYQQDSDGDENWHVYSVDLTSQKVRDLTPFQGVKAQNVLTSSARPGEILVGINLRDPRVFDLFRIDLKTGAVLPDTENPGDVLSFTTDTAFVVRAATAFDPKTGETILRVRNSASSPWRTLLRWPFEESTMFGQINGGTLVASFAPDGNSLYVVSATGSDTARLVRVDAESGRELEVVASDPRSDVAVDPGAFTDYSPQILFGPETHAIQAVGFEYLERSWKVLDPALGRELDSLAKDHPGFLTIESRDRADSVWIVSQASTERPPRYFLFDRASKTTRPLFESQPELDRYTLASPRGVVITARDGMRLTAYLTLPPGVAPKGLPLILLPHGGPWYRDDWGFDPLVQLLANRGYAVLQVNFRGSTGLGKRFLNAGNHEFGLGMQEDLMDGVRWAIREGTADPKRIGVLGGSAGGYATLRAITEAPEVFASAVDLVGPSDLKVLFSSMPAYWGPVKARWIRRIGDVEADDALNRRLSPLYHADRIRAPLLVGQGAHDPRVNIANSDLIVKAARAHGVPVTYIVYPDEGHGFARPENNLDFFGRVEEFLAKSLGGRAEPWTQIPGATAEVR